MGARRILMTLLVTGTLVPAIAAAQATAATPRNASLTAVFPITAPIEGGRYPSGVGVPVAVDPSFSILGGLTVLIDGAAVELGTFRPAPGPHTLQVQTLRVVRMFEPDPPWPATGQPDDCRPDGAILALVCPLYSQVVHFTVLASGPAPIPPMPLRRSTALLRRQIAASTFTAPVHLRSRCARTANDLTGTTYRCAVAWTDPVYAWRGHMTVQLSRATAQHRASVTFTGRRALRSCVHTHGLRRCQRPASLAPAATVLAGGTRRLVGRKTR